MIIKLKAQALQQREIISEALEFEKKIDQKLQYYDFSDPQHQMVDLYSNSNFHLEAVNLVKSWYEEIGWKIESYSECRYDFLWVGKNEAQSVQGECQ